MRVLSFDVGVKNLAYCSCVVPMRDARTAESIKVEHMGVITLEQDSDTIQELLHTLHNLFVAPEITYDMVLVENQPALKNPVMKTVQVAIQTFFTMHSLTAPVGECPPIAGSVHSVSAMLKNGLYKKLPSECRPRELIDALAMKNPYTRNKKLAVVLVNMVLNSQVHRVVIPPEVSRTTLCAAKKKDDLSDAFLQLVAYMCSRFRFEIVANRLSGDAHSNP